MAVSTFFLRFGSNELFKFVNIEKAALIVFHNCNMAPSILFRSPEPSAKYDALSGELPSDHEDVDTDDELLGEKPRKKLTAIGPMWYSLAHISLLFFLANIVLFGLVTFRLIKPAYSSAANGSGRECSISYPLVDFLTIPNSCLSWSDQI